MLNVGTSGRFFAVILTVAVILTGCASPPTETRQSTNPDGQTSAARNTAPKTLRMASIREPVDGVVVFSGNGNILAFFEIPNSPPMGRDPNTPDWVQHIAFKVENEAVLVEAKERLEAAGIPVVGITDHTIFKSIYFYDPNGHRLELAADCATPEQMKKLDDVKWEMLEEWSRTKRAPKQAAWMHERELAA